MRRDGEATNSTSIIFSVIEKVQSEGKGRWEEGSFLFLFADPVVFWNSFLCSNIAHSDSYRLTSCLQRLRNTSVEMNKQTEEHGVNHFIEAFRTLCGCTDRRVLSVNISMEACALCVDLRCKVETSLLLLSHLVVKHVINDLYLQYFHQCVGW